MLQQIIANELNKRLGRTATYAETHNAFLEISDNLGDKPTFETLQNGMDDYIANAYFRCDKCGELHLLEQANEFSGAFGFYRTCNNQDCEQQAYYDAHNDPYRELRTY